MNSAQLTRRRTLWHLLDLPLTGIRRPLRISAAEACCRPMMSGLPSCPAALGPRDTASVDEKALRALEAAMTGYGNGWLSATGSSNRVRGHRERKDAEGFSRKCSRS